MPFASYPIFPYVQLFQYTQQRFTNQVTASTLSSRADTRNSIQNSATRKPRPTFAKTEGLICIMLSNHGWHRCVNVFVFFLLIPHPVRWGLLDFMSVVLLLSILFLLVGKALDFLWGMDTTSPTNTHSNLHVFGDYVASSYHKDATKKHCDTKIQSELFFIAQFIFS